MNTGGSATGSLLTYDADIRHSRASLDSRLFPLGSLVMFSDKRVGDLVVVCSGRPHYQKERRKVTHVDKGHQTFEAAGELYCAKTGCNRYTLRGAAFGDRAAYLPEGENLRLALRGEMIKKLTMMAVRDLKKVSDDNLKAACELFGFKLEP